MPSLEANYLLESDLSRGLIVRRVNAEQDIEVLTFSIEPYAKDPLRFESGRSKYRRYSKKKYTFYLSENIPGHILGIDYEIPKRKKKGAVQEYYGKQQMRLEW